MAGAPSIDDAVLGSRTPAAGGSSIDAAVLGAPQATAGLPASNGAGIPVAPGANLSRPKKHRSLIGGVVHTVGHDVGLAAHDIKSMPGGLLKLGTDLVKGPSLGEVGHEWDALLHGHLVTTKNDALIHQDVPGLIHGSVAAIKHPLRDPFQTLLTVAPIAGAAGKLALGAREGLAGDLAAGTAVKQIVKGGDALDMGKRALTHNGEPAPMHPSTQPLMRGLQHIHDKVVQRALDRSPDGKLASYGTKRISYAIAETHRYLAQQRAVVANELDAGLKHIKAEAKATGVDPQVLQDAIRLTSENDLPASAVKFHLDQAHQGIEPEDNVATAARFQAVHDAGVVKTDAHGNLAIDDTKFPRLAAIDAKIAKAQSQVDHIALNHMGVSREQLAYRIDAPTRIRNGAHFVEKSEAAANAQWAREAGNAAAKDVIKQARAKAREATAQAMEHAKLADGAERTAFNLRTKLTASEREARAAASVVDKAAEKASSVRAKANGQVGEAQRLGGLLERQKRLHDLAYAGFQDGTVSAGKLARSQARLERLTADHAKVAPAAEEHAQATAEGSRLAGVQRVQGPILAQARTDAQAAAAEADKVAGHHTGAAADLFARAQRIKQEALQHVEQLRGDAEAQAQAHLKEGDSIVGGETSFRGRNYVGHGTSKDVKSGQRPPVAPHVGPVVGDIRKDLLGPKTKRFKGQAMGEGHVPLNTLQGIVDHVKDALRYVNTDSFRHDILKYGSQTRRSHRDILVRVPEEQKGDISEAMRIELGQKESTVEATHAEQVGTAMGFKGWLDQMIPSLADKGADAHLAEDGVTAPKGYLWVDRNIVGELARPVDKVGKFGEKVNDVNAIITAMTVYFKLGHVGTRFLTNAATNLIQGSLNPVAMRRAIGMWKDFSETDRRRALALAGQKSYDALPMEGTSRAARAARSGAKMWATVADARFRFNSITYEAAKAGFDTTEKFREMMDKIEHPENYPSMDAAEHAKIDWVVKRADRAAIAYDRLTVTEKRYLARGIWFYPWVKGSSSFAVHFLTEHPEQAFVAGQAGVLGRKHQSSILGDLPEYENGLIPLGHGNHPTVTDFSTFSPFATPADIAQAAANPSAGELAGMASPVLGAADSLIHGTNQYGQRSKNPGGDALSQLFSPTPEAQILNGVLHPPKKGNQKMFQHTWQDALKRSAVGPAAWRRINLTAAHQSAARDRAGR